MTIEFIIGGRVGINTNTAVEMINERAVAVRLNNVKAIKKALVKNVGLWVKADILREPLEIETNGGVMGIRG